MTIDNKIYLLTDKYYLTDEKQKILKIKLMIINNKMIDLSCMFYNCKSLKIFYRKQKEENNFISENEIKEGKKDGENETTQTYDSTETNNQLSYNFYHYNETKKEFNEIFRNKNK